MRAVVLPLLRVLPLAFATMGEAQTSATPADGFTGIWYEITSGSGSAPNKYGGGLATYPQQINPAAIYSAVADKTFFTFCHDPGDGNIRHVVSYFDHATGLVARPQIWLNKATDDAHDAPALAMDGDGYLYLFSNTHGNNRRSHIGRSAAPYAIDRFEALLSGARPEDTAVFGSSLRFCYGSPWFLPKAPGAEKFFLPFTRYIGGARHLFTTSSADASRWTAGRDFARIGGGQYQVSFRAPDGRTVGTMFNYHPYDAGVTPSDARTNLYYLQTSDLGSTWQSAAGATVVDNSGAGCHPLTEPDNPALVYKAAPGERVYLKDMNFDARGRPVLMFLTSPSHEPHVQSAPRQLKIAHWGGENWDVRDFVTTDHNYDYGSIYVEPVTGGERWRVIGPFLDGPQKNATGGEVGVWTSEDSGRHWRLADVLTHESVFNHTYVRRPLDANAGFYAFWADGHAFHPSEVSLFFADQAGSVYRLPRQFSRGMDFAEPELIRAALEPSSVAARLGIPAAR